MHFSELRLTHFRNYASLNLRCSEDINCLSGNNGVGKTNVLEAIHYLCMTRGWQSKAEKFALKEGEAYFSVEGILEEQGARHSIQCNYMPPKGKKILVDKRPLERMSAHIGRIPVVTVLPNDTQLIHGGPALRRRFMDTLISQYAPDYLDALIQYEHALEQRNALLALMHERRTWDPEQVELWNRQLIPNGREILRHRRAFLNDFTPVFGEYFKQIVSALEVPELKLETQFAENTETEWENVYRDQLQRDRFAQRTTAGVHKDELEFSIGGQAVKHYGSQGQQKTFVVALKLAQYDILEAKCGKAPLLLLDDIFDKLDFERLGAIAGLLDGPVKGQVFITDTSLDRSRTVFGKMVNRNVGYWKVGAGKVEEA